MLRQISPLAAVAVLAFSVPLNAQPTEESLLAADAWQQRIIEDEDVEALRAFIHDNYILNGPTGRISRKEDLLTAMAAGGLASDSFERIVEDHQITGNVGIVVGREVVVPGAGGILIARYGSKPLNRQFTNVYIYEDGSWRYLARQATVVSASPAERAPAP